ncbi:MAG: T9SS type A sorting domain-containing protein [Bacteroidetes bacterium]|nr:T9SS type A sorting domain-containing protein [Bacteroidota bacterium]
MKTRILLVLSLLILCSLHSKVFSQWSTDPLVNNPVCTNSGHQTHIKSCSNQDDGGIICWEDDRNGNSDIYAQLIDKHGVNQWQAGGVKVCGASGDQGHPVVCTDGNGGAFIAWADNRTGSGQVYCQRVRRDGVIMWADNGVNASPEALGISYSLLYPEIQHSGSGCIVAMNFSTGICALKFNAFGDYEWGLSSGQYLRVVASGFNANTCTGVQMCPDGGNGAHVCWSGWDGVSHGHKVYAQHLNSDGSNHWSTPSHGKRVCNQSEGHQKKPRLCSDEAAGCEIVWEDGRRDTNVVTGRPNHDIYCERLDWYGNHMWNSDGNPVCTDTADQTNPNCIADTWEGIHMVWQDYRNYDAGPDSGLGVNLYCQNVDFNGNKRWTHNGVQAAILCDVVKAQDPRYNPQICANDDIGGFMLSWLGYSDTTGHTLNNFGVYCQRMNYGGSHQWHPTTPGVSGHPNGARVCTSSGDKHSVTMCNNRTVTMGGDDNSGAVIAWVDDRNFGSSGEDVFAQHIKSTSDLGDLQVGGGQTQSDKLVLKQNTPNPFNPSTIISFNLPKADFVTVKIFDMLGREVATLINNQLTAGAHNVTWNANGYTSGAYFYKITSSDYSEIRKMLLVK